MTNYKQLIDKFRSLCNDHKAIKYFAVGQISDIEVPTADAPEGIYPYVFLRPVTASVDANVITYQMDLVVMDMAKNKEDLETRIHNSTLNIMQDLLTNFRMNLNNEVDVELPVQLTWFVESNKNSTAGWAASLNIVTQNPLNRCETAFNNFNN